MLGAAEKRIFTWLVEYNKNLEDSKSDALLGFITGVTREPPWGFDKAITVKFIAKDQTKRFLPEAMTCFNILWLPQHFRNDIDGKVEFIQAMDKAMELEGKGFALEGTDI